MFDFTGKALTSTTVASTTSNSTFTFPPPTMTQPFIFGSGVKNTSTVSPFGNPPTSNTSTNFASTGFGGTSIFATNQGTSVTQSTNLSGTTLKFNPVSSQDIIKTDTNKILRIKTTFQCISAMKEYLHKSMDELRFEDYQSNRKFPVGNSIFRTNTSPITNAWQIPTSTVFNPFPITTSTAPITTSIFTSTTPTNSFGVPPVTTQSPFGINIFSQSPIVTSSNSIPPTTTSSIFRIPNLITTTTTTSAPSIFNNIGTQSIASTMTPFSFPLAATSILENNTSSVTQTQPIVTSSSSITTISQASREEQNTQQSSSIIQEQLLARLLLDPYSNRGKKDFSNIDHIPIPKESTVVSTLSSTTTTTTVTPSTPIPIILPIQSNNRKISSSRTSVDVNFKLKPVSSSSSSTLNEDIKLPNQRSTTPIKEIKSTLAGNFTDEEELILLSQTKLSKLRLSNDNINSSYQSNSIRSLYPLRNLAELENLSNITRSPSPPLTIRNEQISHASNQNRDRSPSHHHTTSSIIPKQSSSPIISHKSKTNSQNYRLPILTRDNYYMKPNISELKSLFNDKGECILKQFTVGHEQYGLVTFYGNINIAGLNLDEIVEINRHEVTVYPDDDNKPSIGEELNVPARITLFGIYPIDRTTREEITDIDRLKAVNYNDYLRETTKKFDGEFINYDINDGSWTFMVKHFTRYGLDDNL